MQTDSSFQDHSGSASALRSSRRVLRLGFAGAGESSDPARPDDLPAPTRPSPFPDAGLAAGPVPLVVALPAAAPLANAFRPKGPRPGPPRILVKSNGAPSSFL